MTALLIILLLAVFGISFVVVLIGGLLAVIYTLPYLYWIRRQHAAGCYAGWPSFSPRQATKLYLAKLTRSAV